MTSPNSPVFFGDRTSPYPPQTSVPAAGRSTRENRETAERLLDDLNALIQAGAIVPVEIAGELRYALASDARPKAA